MPVGLPRMPKPLVSGTSASNHAAVNHQCSDVVFDLRLSTSFISPGLVLLLIHTGFTAVVEATLTLWTLECPDFEGRKKISYSFCSIHV